LQLLFSGTKGLVAICMLMLIDRRALDLDAAVSEYWPGFAAAGKTTITIREVVTHTARLPGLAVPTSVADLIDDQTMADRLAAQAPLTDARAAHTYHLLTYGWLCGELIRRIDGRSVGRFFAEEVANRLGLELFIGLPEMLEPRVSSVQLSSNWGTLPVFDSEVVSRDELVRCVWANPRAWEREHFPWNEPALHRAEIPAVNGIGTARAVATLYGSLERLLAPETLRLGRTQLEQRLDPLTAAQQAFGVGFELQTSSRVFGPAPDGFGHTGAGGSVHGCWPTQRVGFSYAMNLLRDDADDERAKAVLGALWRAATRASGRLKIG
jgi:CubicO group peptidase (beta-lactamase class C family)